MLLRDDQLFMVRNMEASDCSWSLPMLPLCDSEDGVEELVTYLEDTLWLRVLTIRFCRTAPRSDTGEGETLYLYSVPAFEGEPRLAEGFEGRWFPRKQLPAKLTPELSSLQRIADNLPEYKMTRMAVCFS